MRLKNKFFLEILNKKVNIFTSKFFIMHINQIKNFEGIKSFCFEKNFFLFKVKNSLYRKFFTLKNPISNLLKSSTFFIFIKDFEDFFIFFEMFKFFVKNTNNFFILGFYEKFNVFSIKELHFFFNFYKKNFLDIKRIFFPYIFIFKILCVYVLRVLSLKNLLILKILKLNANNKSIIKRN